MLGLWVYIKDMIICVGYGCRALFCYLYELSPDRFRLVI